MGQRVPSPTMRHGSMGAERTRAPRDRRRRPVQRAGLRRDDRRPDRGSCRASPRARSSATSPTSASCSSPARRRSATCSPRASCPRPRRRPARRDRRRPDPRQRDARSGEPRARPTPGRPHRLERRAAGAQHPQERRPRQRHVRGAACAGVPDAIAPARRRDGRPRVPPGFVTGPAARRRRRELARLTVAALDELRTAAAALA